MDDGSGDGWPGTDGPGGERLRAAALVEELLGRVRGLTADVADQRAALARCGCTGWESSAARGYRDALMTLAGGLDGVDLGIEALGAHLARLAADLRCGRAGDLVDAESRVADAVLRGWAVPGAMP